MEQDILAEVPEADWVSTVKENLKKKFPNGITVGNSEIRIDGQSRQEMTFSRYMQWLYNNDQQLMADKLRATNNADEILSATTDWVNEGLNHPRKDRITDFARGNVLLRVGGNDYMADVVVGTRKNGSMVMYDVLNLQRTSFTEKETNAAISTNPSPGAARSTASVSTDSIAQAEKKDNGKFSFEGNTTNQYSLKGENEDGRERREVRKEEAGSFGRRIHSANETVTERASADYRIGGRVFDRRASKTANENAVKASEELSRLGIENIIYEGTVEINKNGTTLVLPIEEATSLFHDMTVISSELSIDPIETAGHEAFHMWADTEGGEEFHNVLLDNLKWGSDTLTEQLKWLEEHYPEDHVAEELDAYFAGELHAGNNEKELRAKLLDYDAVKAAWDELVRKNGKGKLSLKEDNQNPTSAPDIRYSLKGTEESRELSRLKKETEALKERVSYWKGQTKESTAVTTDKKSIEKKARQIVKDYGAQVDTAEIGRP